MESCLSLIYVGIAIVVGIVISQLLHFGTEDDRVVIGGIAGFVVSSLIFWLITKIHWKESHSKPLKPYLPGDVNRVIGVAQIVLEELDEVSPARLNDRLQGKLPILTYIHPYRPSLLTALEFIDQIVIFINRANPVELKSASPEIRRSLMLICDRLALQEEIDQADIWQVPNS